MSLSARAASAATPETVLELSGVTKRFNGHTVLDSVNLNVTAGETVCLLGPSGSGKSTLLRCINWLEAPDEGSVRLLGQRVGVRADGRRMSDRELASIRTQIGMVFQHFALWPHLTVLQNIMEAPLHVQHRPRAEVREEAEALLELVGLVDKRDVYPARLSGGQRQRVGIARALAGRPPLILLDEPTSALDPERVGGILRIMQDLAQRGMTIAGGDARNELCAPQRESHRIYGQWEDRRDGRAGRFFLESAKRARGQLSSQLHNTTSIRP
jgi:polar amino acid transport system ATP-binding protein